MFHRTHTEKIDYKNFWLAFILTALVISLLLIAGCSSPQNQPTPSQTTEQHEEAHDNEHEHDAGGEMLILPELDAVDLDGETLKVGHPFPSARYWHSRGLGSHSRRCFPDHQPGPLPDPNH